MRLGRRLLAVALLLFVLGACGTHSGHTVAVSPFAPPPLDVPPPPPPEPSEPGPCPYLDEQAVARMTGGQVADVRTSADQPYPACYFYRDNGSEQLSVNVYVGLPEVAASLVDARVPVGVADPVRFNGWEGQVDDTDEAGTLSAIGRTGTAIIVRTDLENPAVTRETTQLVIEALALDRAP